MKAGGEYLLTDDGVYIGVEKPCDICLCEIGVEVTTNIEKKKKMKSEN